VHYLLESQLHGYANNTAITHNTTSISYENLLKESALVAAYLSTNNQPIIAVSTERCITTIINILGILKAGKTYLPLDITLPKDRLENIITDADISTLLISNDTQVAQGLPLTIINTNNLQINGETANNFTPQLNNTSCYVLYTSGSTGKPKGVLMGHASLVNLLQWQANESIAGIGTKTLQFAPLTFDVSFQEIFATLTTGGELILVDDETRLNPRLLLQLLINEKVNRLFLPFVALQYITEFAVANDMYPTTLQEIITAGEQLKVTPQIVSFFNTLNTCKLYNQYGPTECHVVTQLALTNPATTWPLLPSIGVPISNTNIYILDTNLALLPNNTEGELYIQGKPLAEGYLNNIELTNEKFINWQHPTEGQKRLYKSGDLAKVDTEGNIIFLGRIDDQVKVRGYRIELAEIEAIINTQNGVLQNAVVVKGTEASEKKIIAFLIGDGDTEKIRQAIAEKLPDYMMPSAFVWVSNFPTTASGKINKKALPDIELKRPDLANPFIAATTTTQKILVTIWSNLLQLDAVGVNDNFFELGGNSLLALKFVTILQQQHNLYLPITKLYQQSTIANIEAYLSNKTTETIIATKQKNDATEVAIIGMACKFPGADNIQQLWENLHAGIESIQQFTDTEISTFIDRNVVANKAYVAARGIITNVDSFDAAFFGISPSQAAVMDPQQRLFLEVAWQALENAGIPINNDNNGIGIFAGSGNNTYLFNNVLPHKEAVESVGNFQVMTLNEKDYIATRTAYALNLTGPAVSVHSACSTSLLAIAQAVENIRMGNCTTAIAGAASITTPIRSGHLYEAGAMLSKEAHCKPFDDEASGTIFSDGVAAVVLKNKEQAIIDGDIIYAVIAGVGINNDGGNKSSFSAPSATGQAIAIKNAITDAAIKASDIHFIEAHGTATPIGDPIEIEGLKLAFGQQEKQAYCGIGSIKSNFGHLTATAGIAGLIKATLCIYHKKWVSTLNFKHLNKNIALANSPFYICNKNIDLSDKEKITAGVSSFGVGGTNVHIILNSYPTNKNKFDNNNTATNANGESELLCISAKSVSSLLSYAKKLAWFIQSNNEIPLANISHQLNNYRTNFSYRKSVIASSKEAAIHQLQSLDENACSRLTQKEIIFLFPGQGAQYTGMGKALYMQFPIFKNAFDACNKLIIDKAGFDLQKILFENVDTSFNINDTYITQPAIFVIEYALAKLYESFNISPTAFIGHSIGELVAAHLAGIFSLDAALELIINRGKLMFALAQGSMISVKANEQQITHLLTPLINIAAINTPDSLVLAGNLESIAILEKQLKEQQIGFKMLATSHAFHSYIMDDILDNLRNTFSNIHLHTPKKPILSTVTGKWLTDKEATDATYWVTHARNTVNFSAAITQMQKEGDYLYIEIGPKNTLTSFAKQHGISANNCSAGMYNSAINNEVSSVLHTLGKLWENGTEINIPALHIGQRFSKIVLPNYAFQQSKFWLDEKDLYEHKSSTSSNHTHITNSNLTINDTTIKVEKTMMQSDIILQKTIALLEKVSGFSLKNVSPKMNFIELGFDSLLLTQTAIQLKKEFSIPISFKQLNDDCDTIELLLNYIDAATPKNTYSKSEETAKAINVSANESNSNILSLLAQQVQLISQQITLLQGGSVMNMNDQIAENKLTTTISSAEIEELKKPFGATARIEKKAQQLTKEQADFIGNLIMKYNKKTQKSKDYTQLHRASMADPRVVSGFRPTTKELVYPLVVNKSSGSRIWDIDGNEYIDALNGFGSNLLGYQHPAIKKAVLQQIEEGYEVGPQHQLAGEVCNLICELTQSDRAALCNTGTEAVMGAMRIARTVTGKNIIVAFSGSYHGTIDEVIVRGTKNLQSFPAAPGILPEAVQNMLILDYGDTNALAIIKERANDIAAVLVEPVQSRRADFQPIAFLKELRTLTHQNNIALIFDEVITGFRMHPGGTQAMFGIKADIGTYGKVVGGGMPIGAIAGSAVYMDALDGGYWDYNNHSIPEIGVTYFAGTFVRHPLALAAAKASLIYFKEKGEALQNEINALTKYLADAMNSICEAYQLHFYVTQFGSLWKIKYKEEIPYTELLFTIMREKGIHIWDGFPCFLTEAHNLQDADKILQAFKEAVEEMVHANFFGVKGKLENSTENIFLTTPPIPNAKLGRDKEGNVAWFVESAPGEYYEVK